MSDANREVLDFMRAQFARVDGKLDRIIGDVQDLKHRTTSLERQFGELQVQIAAMSGRIDRVDVRLDRMERRHDLVDAALP